MSIEQQQQPEWEIGFYVVLAAHVRHPGGGKVDIGRLRWLVRFNSEQHATRELKQNFPAVRGRLNPTLPEGRRIAGCPHIADTVGYQRVSTESELCTLFVCIAAIDATSPTEPANDFIRSGANLGAAASYEPTLFRLHHNYPAIEQ